MSEEKKAVQKKASGKPNVFTRFISWCKNVPARVVKSFKSMVNELKRVTWPSKRKLIIYSCVVLVFMLCMGLIIGVIDLGASALVKAIGGVI
ncbi:MAG: preprotein translocase subunit SecE [Clostridia bacterium]|nr:preprotein translocase subunit SecE [Clostridia bacterium]